MACSRVNIAFTFTVSSSYVSNSTLTYLFRNLPSARTQMKPPHPPTHLDDRACDNVQPGQGYSWVWNNGGIVISGGKNRISVQKYLIQGHFVHYELHMKSHPESNSGSADRPLLIRCKLCLPRSSRLAVNRPNIESDQAINHTTKESVFHCDWRNHFFIFNMETRSLPTQLSI